MTFGMTPVTGFPPAQADDFPNFIQFQEDGVNLGGPDADTVNFTGNVSATRGEGENAGVITVEVAAASSGGSGAAVAPLVVRLSADGNPLFDGGNFDTWTGTVQVLGDDATWSDADGVTFLQDGVYEIVIVASFGAGSESGYPQGDVLLAAQMQNTDAAYRSTNRTASLSNTEEVMTNTYIYDTSGDLSPRTIILNASSEDHPSFAAALRAQLIVRRLGDAAPEA